ncbi:MAG: GHMP kinase [Bacillota bacterium]
MRGTAVAPGTCGELVQGTMEKINFHITCPVNCYSKVSVDINNPKNNFVYVNDPRRTKVIQAVSKTMLYLTGEILGASVNVETKLPISKGMASSTADITAACSATAKALGCFLSPTEISKIALSIEPSDGLFYPGIVAFDHVKGDFYKEIGEAVDIDLLVYDFGGEIDTIIFNQRPDLKEKNALNEKQVKKAFKLVEKGLRTNDFNLVAQGATLSALTNQNIIYKPELEKVIEIILKNDGLGVNTAHSGTLIGILYNAKYCDYEKISALIRKSFPGLFYLGKFKLINGGINFPLEEEYFCPKLGNMVAT